MAKGFGFASIASMRPARTFAAAVLLTDGTKVLVTGGESSNGPYSAELYDDGTGNWTPSEMTTARSRHTATLLKSGQVLVVGGDNLVDPSTSEVYSPTTNSWQKVFNNLNSPRNAHTATLLADGRVLVTGGTGARGGPTLSTAEIFDPGDDPVNGSWRLVNPMRDARAFHTATFLPNGRVLVAGGSSGIGTLSSAEMFNPTTGIWSTTSSMNNEHAGHTATLLSSALETTDGFVVLVAGGAVGQDSSSVAAEIYKPASTVVVLPRADISGLSPNDGSSWVQVGSMTIPRVFHTATALPAGISLLNRFPQVLVTGGPDPEGIVTGRITEIYDSATNSWTYTGGINSVRTGHTATMLISGKVLLAGGGDNSAELGTGCNATAQIVVSPQQTIDFGQVQAGSELNNSNSLPTVQNTGNALLTLTATISGPDAALFRDNGRSLAFGVSPQAGPCITGRLGGDTGLVFLQFDAWSPVPKACHATLTLSDSNATNVPAGQTWVFPITAQIVASPGVIIKIDAPSFPGAVAVGQTRTAELVITFQVQPRPGISAIVRFPPPPPNGSFNWKVQDYIVRSDPPMVSVPIDFKPRRLGPAVETLELISNAQGSPHLILLEGTSLRPF